MPPLVLAYTTKTLISRNGWLGCQASTRLSGDQPCIVQSGIQEINIQALFACRTEVVVRHSFIGENDDERHIIITFIMFLGANEYLGEEIDLS